MNILFSWIGQNDINASKEYNPTKLGAIVQALKCGEYSYAVILDNYEKEKTSSYLKWMEEQVNIKYEYHHIDLNSPIDREGIYRSARKYVKQIEEKFPGSTLTFHLSPGTPAMSQMWMLLSAECGARMIDTHKDKGIIPVKLPFKISAYFMPDREVENFVQCRVPPNPAFEKILYKSPAMDIAICQAMKVAPKNVPVLIEGESGTGKELFAKAIHCASNRPKKEKFIPVNCGAIPENLIESELFGYEKGAFSGAVKNKPGLFEHADGGTIFLDEFGELPPATQVKLLRVLNNGEITPVGAVKGKKVNVRIIAATNRNLLEEVAKGNFRSDLLYRVAVAIIHLPALRERTGDLEYLIDKFLEKANTDLKKDDPEYKDKYFSDSAKKIMFNHSWPGNARELENTIMRAVLWASGELIDDETVKQSLLKSVNKSASILERPLGNGFMLDEVIKELEQHYLLRAMEESGNNMTQAAKLLGIANYQTVSNRLKKLSQHKKD